MLKYCLYFVPVLVSLQINISRMVITWYHYAKEASYSPYLFYANQPHVMTR